jgi:hypothetical protein
MVLIFLAVGIPMFFNRIRLVSFEKSKNKAFLLFFFKRIQHYRRKLLENRKFKKSGQITQHLRRIVHTQQR